MLICYNYIYNNKEQLNLFITPEMTFPERGPLEICPNTSEQLRNSGNITPLGISKNLKENKN